MTKCISVTHVGTLCGYKSIMALKCILHNTCMNFVMIMNVILYVVYLPSVSGRRGVDLSM